MMYECNTGLNCEDCIGGCDHNLERRLMGVYINPTTCTKEVWLQSLGSALPDKTIRLGSELDKVVPEDHWLVCLVDNGMFREAGVAYSQWEMEAFAEPGDRRPKTWYIVQDDDLRDVISDEEYAQLLHMKKVANGT